MMFSNNGKDPGEQCGSALLARDVACVKLFEGRSCNLTYRTSVEAKLHGSIVGWFEY